MNIMESIQMQQCSKLSMTAIPIKKYIVYGLGSERTYPECTCPAYKYGKRNIKFDNRYYPKTCKHIDEAQEQLVCWHEQWGEEVQTDEQRVSMICPKCGGPTELVNVAV